MTLFTEKHGNTLTNKRRGEDNMKFGEIIDYMMENEIVSTIKTNDGKIIINGEMHGSHSDIPNSNTLYMLVIALNTGAITYKNFGIKQAWLKNV